MESFLGMSNPYIVRVTHPEEAMGGVDAAPTAPRTQGELFDLDTSAKVSQKSGQSTGSEPEREAVQPKAALATAHEAVELAELVLAAETARPPSPEHWERMASALECRAAAWRLLATASDVDKSGHSIRAMELAATADTAQARLLRVRLGVSG